MTIYIHISNYYSTNLKTIANKATFSNLLRLIQYKKETKTQLNLQLLEILRTLSTILLSELTLLSILTPLSVNDELLDIVSNTENSCDTLNIEHTTDVMTPCYTVNPLKCSSDGE